MHIRDAEAPRDAAACAAIYAPFVSESAVSFEVEPPDAAEFARRIGTNSASYPYLVAESDAGETIGFAYAGTHRARAAYRWAAEVSVYIHGEHRRRGVGRALYGELLPLMRRQGLRIALAGITLPNDSSVALHEAMGFAPVGIYKGIGFKAGSWRDVGWWQLDLGPAIDGTPVEPSPSPRLGA
jgi:L-amino acid N-acyltransferase YncA